MSNVPTCPEPLLLEALADGRLAPEERQPLADHLSACPACRREFEEIERLKRDLKLAGRIEPLVETDPHLEERIFTGALRERARRRLAWVLAPAAAVTLLALLVVALPPVGRPPPEAVRPVPTAQILRVEGPCAGLLGSELPPQQVVSTGEAGRVLVRFGEDEYLLIGGRSRLSWHPGEEELVFRLEAGSALFRFEGPVHRPLRVETPPAVVRTLGTVFALELSGDRALGVEMFQGAVELRPRQGEVTVLQAPHCAQVSTAAARPALCRQLHLADVAAMREGKLIAGEPAAASLEQPPHPVAAAPSLTRRPAASAPALQESLEHRIDTISGLLARRQFERADALLEETLRLYAQDFRPLLLRCDSLRLQEKFEEALFACRAAEERARQEHQKELSLYQQGRLLLQLGRAAEAETIFEWLLASFPAGLLAAESRFGLLEAQLKQEEYSRARDTARTYLEKYPQGAGAREVRQLLLKLEEEE